MVGLGLKIELNQAITQAQEHKIKQQLKQLEKVSLSLRHEPFPGSVKGLEGIEIADKILKEKGAVGLLIGGLSEAIWNPRNTRNALNALSEKHKDVDVLIPYISPGLEIDDFEGGVDWWLPRELKIKIKYESATVEENVLFWENCLKVRLAFTVLVRTKEPLLSGLYIPEPDFIRSMREAEVFARVDTKNVEVEESTRELFGEKLRKRIKNANIKAIEKKGLRHDSVPNFIVQEIDHETFLAINSIE